MTEWFEQNLPCNAKCELTPPNIRVTEVPPPRNDWPDVLICSHCGRAWRIHKDDMIEIFRKGFHKIGVCRPDGKGWSNEMEGISQ